MTSGIASSGAGAISSMASGASGAVVVAQPLARAAARRPAPAKCRDTWIAGMASALLLRCRYLGCARLRGQPGMRIGDCPFSGGGLDAIRVSSRWYRKRSHCCARSAARRSRDRFAFNSQYGTKNGTLRESIANSWGNHAPTPLRCPERLRAHGQAERARRGTARQAARCQPRGSDHWLIVPLQHATAGSPPLETWLDSWLRKTLGTPYYVGLLSAAETYGASPYAVMGRQWMVENKRRPVTVGRHQLVFHACSRIEAMPTRWHESADGRFKVSTPELTVLDLIERESMLGGMGRVREVLHALWPHCTPEGLTQALDAMQSVPVAQRLGALLALDEKTAALAPLQDWLRDKPTRLIALEGALPRGDERTNNTNADFKVWVPPQQGANT